MNSRFRTSIILAAAALTLAACTPNDTTMGGAFKHNVAVQTIDPDPEYSGEQMEGGDGTHAAAATDRYLKGAVKEPVTLKTTSGSGSSSGSGSGSGPR